MGGENCLSQLFMIYKLATLFELNVAMGISYTQDMGDALLLKTILRLITILVQFADHQIGQNFIDLIFHDSLVNKIILLIINKF